jgi:stearoyl-CoA desaturase (delta-9 desaturase)
MRTDPYCVRFTRWFTHVPTLILPTTLFMYRQGYMPTMHEACAGVLATVCIEGICMSVCLHRYFSHGAFKASRPVSFVLGVLSTLAGQQGPLWWASKHIRHHKFCDKLRDPHSWSQTSFLYAWIGVIYYECATDWENVPQHFMYPELIVINNFAFVPNLVVAALVQHIAGTARMFYWFVLPSFAACLLTLSFNLTNHPQSPLGKTNVHCLAINGLNGELVGEGHHENHHKFPKRAHRPGIDLPYWFFLLPLEKLRLVWDLNLGPQKNYSGFRMCQKQTRFLN